MLGSGIIQGLAVTAKNLVGSFHDPERLTTVEYPEQKLPLPENYRSFPFLVFDGTDPMAGLRCVACKVCETECPPQCIYIVIERDEKGKPTKKPKVFDIDISVCMGCQICVETCPFDSIKMDQVFEVTAKERFKSLILSREDLAKSNEYYHSIHPTEATEVDARLAEEKRVAAEKAKAAAAAKVAAAAKASATAPAPAAAAGTVTPATPAAAKPTAATPSPAPSSAPVVPPTAAASDAAAPKPTPPAA